MRQPGIAALALALGLAGGAAAEAPVWLAGVAGGESRAGIETLRADAEVTVSDGSSFVTQVLYHDPQRAAMRQIDGERVSTFGVEGRYYWTFDGEREAEGDDFVREFVLGHQFHALILFFDRIFPGVGPPSEASFGDAEARMVSAGEGGAFRGLYYDPAGRPLGLRMHYGPRTRVVVEFLDWRDTAGIELPWTVRIEDGERTFVYRYTDVRFGNASLDAFRAPEDKLTDEQALLRLHRKFMDAHLFGSEEGLRPAVADDTVVVSRGEVLDLSADDTVDGLARIFATRDYTVYDDAIRPRVRVSDDGTLGWVIVQVAAEGTVPAEADREGEPFEFVSAWIELYEKRDGAWRMVGNVSNFRP